MSMKAAVPVHINHPHTESKNLADRLHCAILNGKIGDVINLLDIGKICCCRDFDVSVAIAVFSSFQECLLNWRTDLQDKHHFSALPTSAT